MKIVFLTTCYPRKSQSYSGIFIHRQAKALKELGAEVHIVQPVIWFPPFGLHRFHSYWQNGYEEYQNMYEEVEGIPIHHPKVFIKMPSRFFPENHWERMGKTVGRYIKKNSQLREADWIYAHFLCHEGYAGTFASDITGIPLAAIARGDDVHAWPRKNPNLKRNLHKVFKKANVLLANSNKLANDTKEWFPDGFDREVFTVYNGVDTDFFLPVKSQSEKKQIRQNSNLPLDCNLLLCMGTPVKLKGWLELLDAVQLLGEKFKSWKLIIVTPDYSGTDRLDLSLEAKSRNIHDKLIHLNQIPQHEVPDLLRGMDCFILPSHNEGMSNSVLESLATGLPVITTKVGGHPEVIMHSVNGHLIEPNDVIQLSQALERIILDTKYRKKLGSNAGQALKNIGSYISNAEKLLTILKNALFATR